MSKIKEKREKLKLSQAELAKKLGVTQGAVSQWESETTFPRGTQLKALAAALECTVDELLA